MPRLARFAPWPIALLVGACSTLDAPSEPERQPAVNFNAAAPELRGHILFYRNVHALGFIGDVYHIRANGTGLRALTDNPADDFGADLSPDRRRIVFTSDRDGNYQTTAATRST